MITVVVPAFNASHSISACVAALQRQEAVAGGFEIIVVDDGSTDGTGQVAEQAGALVLRNEQRLGAAAARNLGIRRAAGEIICFTDADCVPDPGWLAEMKRALGDPTVAGCKGIYTSRQERPVARFVQLEYEDKYDLLRSQPRIDFIDTYSAGYRREVLVQNGGFDERFRFVEDQELSFRLAARGYEMVFQPSAVVSHKHSDSVRAYFRKKYHIGYWKAQIVRRYPDRAVKDSHTPQVMKLQMLLAGLTLATLPAAFIVQWGFALPLALVLWFGLTTIPFLRKAWLRDKGVTGWVPVLLGARAVALGLGYGWGVLRPEPGISSNEYSIGGIRFICKRAMDLGGSVVGLLIFLAVWPAAGIAIKLDSKGPVIFKQERIGQGGRPFTLYKFRSMIAGPHVDKRTNGDPGPERKATDDARLTTVGKLLRRWSIDELPQFWNVLLGEMSLVGPRPEEARIVAGYSDWQRRRLAVKPGLTGPMQVSGRADLTLDERVRLELEYIANYSLWLDITLLARTLPSLIRGAGAR